MSYCPNCGTQNPDSAKFCNNCGTAIPKVEPVVEKKTSSSVHSPAVGSKVSLTAQDGKTYTGTIQEVKDDQYKIKYDGFDFEAWLTQAHFTVLAVAPAGTVTTTAATVQSQPQTQPHVQPQAANPITVGTKVSLIAQDGKAYTGTIEEANGDQYKIKYDGFDFEAWLTKEHFTVLPAGSSAASATVQSQPQTHPVSHPQHTSSIAVGTKVNLTAQDGKRYTGTIQEANGNQYKIKYDGYNFEAWLTPENFSVISGGSTTTTAATVQSQPQQASSIAVGTKVSLVAQDGKAYTGTIQQANGEQYKIKYDGFNFEAWLTKEHFTILQAGSSASTATTVQAHSSNTIGIGSRVSLTAQDGKAYTGVVQEVNGDQYKIKYDGFNFEAWLTKEHFTAL